jgi:hypothetical protein
MARKSRLDPGGFAYGELAGPARGQEHWDAPLSRRGRLIWRITLLALIVLVAAVVVAAYGFR